MSCLAHGAREAGPDHRVACHQSRKRFFAQTLGSRGPLGNHHIAHFGGRVPDSDFRARRQGHAKLREYPARISDHAGPIRCALVPDRWQSQDRPRVATAKRADNYVVSAGRVRDGNHVLTLPTRSEEHTSELQSRSDLVCRLLLEKKKKTMIPTHM